MIRLPRLLSGTHPVPATVLILASVVSGCDREPTRPLLTAPGVSSSTSSSSAALVDAAHGKGSPHFYFLPPMVSASSYSGVFDASLSPIVEICVMTGDACATPLVATYTTTSGPGGTTVRVNTTDQNYIVNWHTGSFSLDPNALYRVRVKIERTELGHADIRLVNNASAAKNASTSDVITLAAGQTLPIKFRIEQGAVAVIASSGGVARLNDGAVTLAIPGGAVAAPIAVTATPLAVGADGTDTGVLPGTFYDFQPSPTTFGAAVTLALAYPAVLPPHTKASRLALCKMVNGACRPIAGSRVDTLTRKVTGPISSFSEYAITEWPEMARGIINGFGQPESLQLFTAAGEVIVLPDIGGPLSYLANFQWIPGGNRLVYIISEDGGHTEAIRSVNSDGSGVVTLVETGGANGDLLQLSPDGGTILFTRSSLKANNQVDSYLMAMSITGSDVRTMATLGAISAAWSPDGRKITFSGDCGTPGLTDPGICVINADGTGLHSIANALGREIAWSPDGRQIAFSGYLWGVALSDGLHVVNADGTIQRRIVDHKEENETVQYISWSPTGEDLLLYELSSDFNTNTIHTIRSDGSNDRTIVSAAPFDHFPVWSPNGSRIAFDLQQNFEVWLVNADGTGLQRLDDLQDARGPYVLPRWRP